MVPVAAPLIILDSKYAVCMDKNGKDNKHTRHIDRRVHYVRNSENANSKILIGVKEVYNYQTLQLRMLSRMI